MAVKYPVRWLWVVVAALAVAPVHAQTEQPAWNPPISDRLAAAFSQDAQAPGPASSSATQGNTNEIATPISQEVPHPLTTEPGATQGNKIAWTANATAKKAAAKYDVAQIGSRPIGTGLNFYSLEKEQRLGRELASELEQQARLIEDPIVTEYVNRVGQNLVRNSDAKVLFTIKVIDDGEINALALPGGFFYVNSGLILAADNEAELAGVMAHEIAHVAARHATKNLTKGQIWNMASIPLIFVGGGAGFALRQVVAIAVPMSFFKFSRNAEREADLLGLEYQYAAGYDPSEFVQFFEKVRALEKRGKHSFVSKLFSTHPMTEDRIKRAQQEIASLLPARQQYVVTTSEFDNVKARLAKVTDRLRVDESKGARPTLQRRTSSQVGHEDTKRDGADAGDQPPTLTRKPM